jgi:choline kinase/phosphatidylglycerophosphate synthase
MPRRIAQERRQWKMWFREKMTHSRNDRANRTLGASRTHPSRLHGERDVVGVILATSIVPRSPDASSLLTIVAGRTLLERAMEAFRRVGIESIVVVLGQDEARVRDLLRVSELSPRGTAIADVAAGDGASALIRLRADGRRCLIVMGDHVFEAAAISRVLGNHSPFVLAVDTRGRTRLLDGAAKVALQEGLVTSISTDLVDWDAVDAGFAVCEADVAEAAARCVGAGRTGWDGVKRRWLEEGGAIEPVDLSGTFWTRAATPQERRDAEREIVRLAARQPYDGTVFRYVDRPVSWRVSLWLVRLGIPPAPVTASAFAIGTVAAGLLALGAVWAGALVIGGVLVQFAAIVDAVNGEVARASLRSSAAGSFFDSVLDHVADPLLLGGLAVAAGLGGTTWLALTLAVLGSLLGAYVSQTYGAVYRRPPPRPLLRVSFGRDARLLAIAIFAVILQPFWGLVGVAVLANVEAGQRFVAAALAARLHETDQIDAAGGEAVQGEAGTERFAG